MEPLDVPLSPQELQRCERGRKVTIGSAIGSAAIGAAYWYVSFFRPKLAVLDVLAVALVVLPWIALGIAARSKPLYRFVMMRKRGAPSGEPQPDLAGPLLLPAFFLAATVWNNASSIAVLQSRPLLLLGCIVGCVLFAAVARLDPTCWQRLPAAPLVILAAACIYGYGACGTLNRLADGSVGTVYPAQVLSKRICGSGKSSYRCLILSPWGPVRAINDVSVSQYLFNAHRAGERVCIALHPGAFHIAWYQVGNCLHPS